jgi:hypothetical protein
MATREIGFKAELILGHKGVMAVIVPFDPMEIWKSPPVRLAGRRHGWLVKGTANKIPFDGYIGERWGRFFITLSEDLLAQVHATPGDTLSLVVGPTSSPEVAAIAVVQSRVTTQPKKPRADAVALDAAPKKKGGG